MATASFADYPTPLEVISPKYNPRAGTNPVLRGLPLVLGAGLLSRSRGLQKFFWNNAGFGTIKDMPVLDEVQYTFHPCVTPLGKTEPMLQFEPHLQSPPKREIGAHYYTASDYHEMYKSGNVTPLQVVETLLGLTSQDSKTPTKYQDAWADSHGADHLALEAAKASTERYATGKQLGLFDGVPFGVKDDLPLKGYVSHIGMKYRDDIPFFKPKTESVWPVLKLQEAGAIAIGKNRMQELGSDTNGLNVSQGTPTNHLNNSYYPGGSSSGGASSVGVGIVPFVVATDAGGSIRIPSNYNGIYGLKTSHHRTMFFNNTMCIAGPIAANVADLTIAYRIMSQPNPACPIQGRFALSVPPAPSAKRTMGVYRDWWAHADQRVQDVCNQAVDYFAKQKGYEIVDITIPYIDEAQLAHSTICVTEMAEEARRRHPDPSKWMSLVGSVNKVVLSVGSQTPAGDYLKYNSMRTLLMRHLAFLFQKYPGLLIVSPTSPMIGWPRTAGDDSYGMTDANITIKNMMFIFLANMTGTPSIAVPAGYVDPDQGEGQLCISLQATGEWGSEEQLLAWGAEAEEYLHETYPEGRRKPRDWVDVLQLASTVAAPETM